MSEESIAALGKAIDQAKSIVCFTGAGISTESGIPDFRSPGTGLWTKIKPIQFQDFIASAEVRQASWARKFAKSDDSSIVEMEDAHPNKGHFALARLVELGKCSAIITQNVDNLHQNSGVPDSHVIELHGNACYAKCLDCGCRYELDQLRQQFEQQGHVEDCAKCGGIVKTATVSFGQAMPEVEMQRAQLAVEQADLMLVLGSSLTVYPAAGFPEYAQRLGATLAIVNREPTPLDDQADIVIHEQIGPTLSLIVGLN